MLGSARSNYAFQDFRFFGKSGELFLEDYRSTVRGSESYRPGGIEAGGRRRRPAEGPDRRGVTASLRP
ncbi:hypothetical protein AB0D38_13820 [Streptomyces sp. NPDC048279]|uniref:hypothetical protein n=1 Tax=Streptomyces sp. NPDC048279 TaxID=3154714 RepID=UPI003444C8BF